MKSPFPKYNVIMIGDSSTGKSSMLLRLIHDKLFSINKINSTIGVDFGVKLIELNKTKQTIKLHIWDTAGHERYRTILNSYYNKGDAVILVFDVTNKKSFDKLEKWLKINLFGLIKDIYTDKVYIKFIQFNLIKNINIYIRWAHPHDISQHMRQKMIFL